MPAAAANAAVVHVPSTYRGKLFRKYLLLILTLVTGALLVSGAISVYFSYQENKSALASLQSEKAVAAASRIEQYVRQIEQQLSYAALPQFDARDIELRRIEFLKLLRQAPEVTDIAQIDADGREQIAVSRLGMDAVGSGRDRSEEPGFRGARRGQPWLGPVYFRKETEPYMTIAIRSGGDKGPVTIADVNLKFIWDVVSRIKIGDKGKAYVVDANCFLVADPDIGLVLRKTNVCALPHVKAAFERAAAAEHPAMLSVDLNGIAVLASVALIDPLGWKVFVEQPVSEVYARLNASIVRTGLLLLAGLVISALVALALARGMVRPIRTLSEGAQRIGEGNLDQNIVVSTGDELEALADRFNRMSAQLRESYAELERKVEVRTQELTNSLEQQTAISEILRVISSSPGDVRPMLNAVAERALKLCDAAQATILLVEGNALRRAASFGSTMSMRENELLPLTRGSVAGRAVVDRVSLQIDDLANAPEDEFPVGRELQRRIGHHTALAVPLMREDRSIGAIQLWRMEARAFTEKQIALVKTFADQAAIAIENVRLFNETKEALEQQTAISEILRVISSSPTDVQPVLEAIAERAARLCDAAAASIYLTDGDKLRHLASKGPSPDPVISVDALPINRDSTSGRALLERRTIHVRDMQAEAAEYPLSAAIAQRSGHRTILVMPLLREGQPFGTILLRRQEVRPFSDQEIALVRMFGDQAAIALENVRLFNETEEALEQQTATAEVLKTISRTTFELDPVLETLIENAIRLCKAAKGFVLMREGASYRLAVNHGATTQEAQAMLSQYRLVANDGSNSPAKFQLVGPDLVHGTLEGRTTLTSQVVHVVDAHENPLPNAAAGETPLRTMLGVPMLRQGEPIGVVAIWREDARQFSSREIQLVTTFADQAVIAVENVRLFQEIQEKSRQLEIANKHKSEFLASMSHELRTPLNAIIGFSEVLLERYFGEINAKQDDYLKDIHSSGRHLLALINDVLDLSKVEAGRMELERSTFDFPGALTAAMTLVRERALQHSIALELEVDAELGEVTADERKVKQILVNLLSNAVKFTPDGGRITVSAKRDGTEIMVAVRDTGIGIRAEDQEAVFEEFRQVGRDYTSKHEGTGLGLALTRRFVELHGGRIWLESALGEGSTFYFTLPGTR